MREDGSVIAVDDIEHLRWECIHGIRLFSTILDGECTTLTEYQKADSETQ